MDPAREPGLLGRLAVHHKLITILQLAQATRAQARAPGAKRLGEIFVELGFVTDEQIDWLLEQQIDYIARQKLRADAAAAPPKASPTSAAAPAAETPDEPEALEVELTDVVVIEPATAEPVIDVEPTDEVVEEVRPLPGASPRMQFTGPRALDNILEQAVAHGASDLHVHAGYPLTFRIHGALRAVGQQPLTAETTERMIQQILTDDQWRILNAEGQLDLAYEVDGTTRVRGNIFRQHRGYDATLRLVPLEPPTLTDLGLPNSLAAFTNFHQGMVLVTGPAGCGKSSTLAGLIKIINEERTDHILSIEDPVECVHAPLGCVVNQREVRSHTESFARALRAALREDPDIIAIGEMRDLETISLAITAAETGHLVLGTLHTNNTIRTINRLVGVFPPEEQDQIRMMISESLRAIISQRLLPRADGKGRVAALEILVITRAVANLIRENKTFQIFSVLQTGAQLGMRLLDDSIAELVRSGVVKREDALKQCVDPKRIPA
ncbi:MAG: type IV pilus twitching motility protein PilT [Myxococcota bacterium]